MADSNTGNISFSIDVRDNASSKIIKIGGELEKLSRKVDASLGSFDGISVNLEEELKNISNKLSDSVKIFQSFGKSIKGSLQKAANETRDIHFINLDNLKKEVKEAEKELKRIDELNANHSWSNTTFAKVAQGKIQEHKEDLSGIINKNKALMEGEDLSKSLVKSSKALIELKLHYAEVNKEIENYKEQLLKLEAIKGENGKLKASIGLEKNNIAEQLKDAEEEARYTKILIDELRDGINKLPTNPLGSFLQSWEEGTKALSMMPGSMFNSFESISDSVKAITGNIKNLTTETSSAISSITGLSGAAIAAGAVVAATFAAGTAVFTKFSKTLLTLGWKGAVFGIKKIGEAIKNLGARIQKTREGFSRFIHMMGRMALYRVIRQAISSLMESFSELWKALIRADIANNNLLKLNETMSALKSESVKFGANITALAGQLITILGPALLRVVELLNAVANGLNRFIAGILGTGKYMKVNTNFMTDYAESLDDAAGSAKKLKGQLAGFDEINNINTNKETGIDYESAFAGIENVEPITGWYGTLLDIINGLISKIGEFNTWIIKVCDNVNAFGAKLHEVFRGNTEEQAQVMIDKFKELGSSFGSIFNTLNNNIDWGGLGATIGAGLDLITQAIASFWDSVNWEGIGSNLSNFVNNIVSEIDFETLGKVLIGKWNALIKTLKGFIENLNWSDIAKKFATGFKSMVESVNLRDITSSVSRLCLGLLEILGESIKTLNWTDLGLKIGDAINAIDWRNIAKRLIGTLGDFLRGILDLLCNAAMSVNWIELVAVIVESIGTLLIETLKSFPQLIEIVQAVFTIGVEIATGLLGGIVYILGDIVDWINEHIFQPFIDGVKKLFGIHSPSTVMADVGNNIALGLLDGIKLSEAWDKISSWFGEKLDNMKSWCQTTWEGIKNTAGDKWEGIKSTISGKVEDIKSATKTGFNKLFGGVNEETDSGTNQMSGIWGTVLGNISGEVGNWGTSQAQNMGSIMSSVASNIGSGLENGYTNFSNFLKSSDNALSSWAKGMADWAYNGAKGIADNIASGVKAGIESLNQLVSAYKNARNEAKSSFYSSGVYKTVAAAGQSISNALNKFIANTVGSIKLPSISTYIPHLANGGVVSSPTTALVGEYPGARSNPEIITPENKMRAIFNEGNAQTNRLLEKLIDVVDSKEFRAFISQQEIGESAVNYINTQNRIMGGSII